MEDKPKRKKTNPPPQITEHDLEAAQGIVYFTEASWRGVKTVFKCVRCGTFRDDRDAMIEHVLLHYPKGEQEAILEKLVKET